jgi:hypothetical protein
MGELEKGRWFLSAALAVGLLALVGWVLLK